MNNSEFFEAVRLLSKEKNVSESALLEGIQRAIVTAVKRDYNNKDIVFCEIDEQDKKIRVFVRKNVVGEITDPDEDVTVEQAQRFKKNAVAGDIIEIELETKEVSRIAAEKGKHILRQAIREAEHGQIREEFQNKNQEIVTAKVSKIDPITLDAPHRQLQGGRPHQGLCRRRQGRDQGPESHYLEDSPRPCQTPA